MVEEGGRSSENLDAQGGPLVVEGSRAKACNVKEGQFIMRLAPTVNEIECPCQQKDHDGTASLTP
jgi:hypothetical protein